MPALNAERHFENGHSHVAVDGQVDKGKFRGVVGNKFERSQGKENRLDDRNDKADRRPNSKELIEKQKNWTSHFSKARPSRYSSDPNHSLVQSSLNQNSVKHEDVAHRQGKESKRHSDGNAAPATRSASFCASRPSPATSPLPPPPPPTRNSSAVGTRQERLINVASSPTDSIGSPEYATVNKLADLSPEYAEVQKAEIETPTSPAKVGF